MRVVVWEAGGLIYENGRKESFYIKFILQTSDIFRNLKIMTWLKLSRSRENKKAALVSVNIRFTSIYVPGEFLGILIPLEAKKFKN